MICTGSFSPFWFIAVCIYCVSIVCFIHLFLTSQSPIVISIMGVLKLTFGLVSFGMSFVNSEDVQEVPDYLKENNFTQLDIDDRYFPTLPGHSEELLGETRAGSIHYYKSLTLDVHTITTTLSSPC